MRMKLDKVIVLDIEATCWEPKPTIKSKELESEIIEIGLCTVDLTDNQSELFGRGQMKSILVKPKYSKVSKFCTELTTLTQEQVDSGVSLYEACQILEKEYDSRNYTWVSYGDYDRNTFQDECRSKGVSYPFGPRHLNIKNLFALMYRLDKEVGMPTALEKLGLPLDGTHHRGVDDAMNIAKIVSKVLSKRK
ncbi:MAG TPA: 3'-5' exonuclease [Anaerovoracaceae bacterium]|nr:3'-5' exonuclease [Anaerovoracaceae bacterium]